MTHDNIEQFNECVGVLFSRLYEAFPARINIEVLELTGTDEQGYPIEENRHMENVYADTWKWLAEAGYIATPFPDDRHTLRSAVLTPKGLECLKGIPETNSKSLGDSLVETAKDITTGGAKKALGDLAAKALTGAFVLATQTVMRQVSH